MDMRITALSEVEEKSLSLEEALATEQEQSAALESTYVALQAELEEVCDVVSVSLGLTFMQSLSSTQAELAESQARIQELESELKLVRAQTDGERSSRSKEVSDLQVL